MAEQHREKIGSEETGYEYLPACGRRREEQNLGINKQNLRTILEVSSLWSVSIEKTELKLEKTRSGGPRCFRNG